MKYLKAALLTLCLMFASFSAAFAEGGLDLSTVTIDTSPMMQLAGIIISAIASIWVIKKLIKVINRS